MCKFSVVSCNIENNHVKVLILKSLYSIGFGAFFLSFLSTEDGKLDMLIFGEYFNRKEMEPLNSDWGNKGTKPEM